jgi:ParB family transcriptional regulator, chromosome partitioning protein
MEKALDTASKKRKKMALGRGLDSLIPDMQTFDSAAGSSSVKDFFHCDIELIQPNRFQPRMRFAQDELVELSDSIRTQGILQPLLVRRAEQGYELATGERRLRAAKMAGLESVPVMLKEISDAEMLEISIVENIQRQNLNPIEEAEAYHRLMTEFELTQEQAAERVGKSRSAVANFLRLRQLSEPIKAGIMDGLLSMGHARALLGLDTPALQGAAFRNVMAKGLSVRQTEALVKRLKQGRKAPAPNPGGSLARHLKDLSEGLSRQFGTKVQIKRKGQKGRVEIEFYNDEDLQRLLTLLQH